jgi:hypothetical protein
MSEKKAPSKGLANEHDGSVNADFTEKLNGLSGRDLLIGSAGNDALNGGSGRDVLIGARGDDVIKAASGDDYLSGNQGRDLLSGGSGADVFVFDGNFDQDVVEDFSARQGDSFQFVIYEEDRADWTADTFLGLCTQVGRDVLIELPDADESVTIAKTELAELQAEQFDVYHYHDDLLVA